MSAERTLPVHLYAQIGDSTVLNDLGTIEVTVQVEPITDDTRQPGDAVEATMRVVGFDIPTALRLFAEEWERQHSDGA